MFTVSQVLVFAYRTIGAASWHASRAAGTGVWRAESLGKLPQKEISLQSRNPAFVCNVEVRLACFLK